MATPSQDREYYFDDEDAPDGRRTYHLRMQGRTPDLFRDDKPIRKAVNTELAQNGRLFESGVLRVLEYFLANANKALERTEIEDAIGNLEPYLGRIRDLLEDPLPGRLIRKAGKGKLVFSQDVRDTPSIFHSAYRKDLREHWKPRAMGLGAAGTETLFQSGRWYFSGRTVVLRHIIQWLGQESLQGFARVVTGHPGCGKSAVLGYIVAASDRGEIQRPELKEFLESIPEDARPKPGGIDFAIDLRRKTLAETLSLLGDRFRCRPDEVIRTLTVSAIRRVLVFDGLEEARESTAIANQVLRILTGYDHLWLLVGCQRPQLPRLGGSVVALDLDEPDFRDDADLVRYVESILLATYETRNSPYRGDETAAHKAAELIAEASAGNFLVAFISTRSLVEGPEKPVLHREALPRTAKDAFDHYLRRLGSRSELGHATLRRALTPLVYSCGEGLPVDVWARFTTEDVYVVLELMAAFIAEHQEDGHTVYRLYHAALAEALHEAKQDAELHFTIAETLIAAVPERDWFRADWYTRKYLAQHAGASASKLLDTLVLDTNFLTVAYPSDLLRVADRVLSEEGRRRVNWYRLTADRLARTPDFGERLSYLELTARQNGAADLAESTKSPITRRWTVSWALWEPETPHLILRGHTGEVNAIAMLGESVISGGGDATVRFWNRRTGEPLVPVTPGHVWAVRALAVAAGRVLSGGDDTIVRVWDPTTGDQLKPCGRHPSLIRALATLGEIAVSVGVDGTVAFWSRLNGEETDRNAIPLQVKAVACHGDWLALGTDDGRLFLNNWSIAKFKQFHFPGLTSLAMGEDVLVVNSGSEVQIYDWRSEKQIGNRLFNDDLLTIVAMDGDLIAAGGLSGVIRCWNWRTGIPITSDLFGHEGPISALALSGGFIASGSYDGTVRLWNLNNIARVGHVVYPGHPLLVVGAFENTVVGVTTSGAIRVRDIEGPESTGRVINDENNDFFVGALEIDREVIMALTTGHINIGSYVHRNDFYRWDRNGGPPVVQSLPLERAGSVMAMSRDLIVVGYEDGGIHVFAITNGLVGDSAYASLKIQTSLIALAITGRTVACVCQDGTVQVWDIKTGIISVELESLYSVKAVGLSSRFIAVGTEIGDLQIWDRRSRLMMATISLGSFVSSIAVNDDYIYVSCLKGIVRVDWHGFS